MRKQGRMGQIIFIAVLLYLALFVSVSAHSAIIIDHNCTDLSQIPDTWIDQVKTMNIHYAHTSHGEQLTVGLERIEATIQHTVLLQTIMRFLLRQVLSVSLMVRAVKLISNLIYIGILRKVGQIQTVF